MNLGNRFYAGMSTPWGRIQDHHRIDGVVSVSTAGHGINWLSDDARALSAVHRDGAVERGREDGALVLQYLGLLSLMLELQVTQTLIRDARAVIISMKGESGMAGRLFYKRQTGDDCGEMICQSHLSPSPGGYRLVVLSDEVNAFMEL